MAHEDTHPAPASTRYPLHPAAMAETAHDRPRDWIDALSRLRDARTPCALVVVAGLVGSGPREPGARMVVAGGRPVHGTIGGGRLEQLACEHAMAQLARGSAVETIEVPLSDAAGQCCGGKVRLHVETYAWRRPKVVVFGAGHVAQALAGLAPWLGADMLLVDPRRAEELVPEPPAARAWELLLVDAPEAEVDELPSDALVLVMTHSHALDLEILARALARDFAYLGLIGSARKWSKFRARLLARGATEDQLARVRCPIGMSKHSKEPNAIALSVAAELSEHLARADAR
jgi:xanthine dehydrogenase accessory factor